MGKLYKLAMVGTAVISLNNYGSAWAEETTLDESEIVNVSRGIIDSCGNLFDPSDKDSQFKNTLVLQDKAAADQQAYEASWKKYSQELAYTSIRSVGINTLKTADHCGRYVLAWNMNHLAVDTLEEVTATIAWGVATLSSGPTIGAGAYTTVKSAIKVMRYILPGFEGYLSGLYAPATKKLILDPAIYYTPKIVKSVAKAGVVSANAASKGVKTFFNWLKG